MALPKLPLGSSGLEISTIGFGSWAVGGGGWVFGWGPQDDRQSITTMRHAIEMGINWIDTAAVYGLGHSEEVIRRLLHELHPGELPYIFTKCGVLWNEKEPMAKPARTLRPESIRRECEASLKRLGIERIDLYQFHWPDESGAAVEDSWNAMLKLIEEGKVRAAGVSNFDVSLLDRCERVRHVDSLQPPFSMINRSAAAKEIPWCARHNTGVICYSPLQSGLLTDTFTESRVGSLATDDWRRRGAEFQQPNLGRNLALRDSLRELADEYETTVAALAIAWVLAWPGVTGAIVGARSPEQIDAWIGAASLELASTDMEAIGDAIAETGSGSGPLNPGATRVPPAQEAKGQGA